MDMPSVTFTSTLLARGSIAESSSKRAARPGRLRSGLRPLQQMNRSRACRSLDMPPQSPRIPLRLPRPPAYPPP
eukprot:3146167-Heterocapsa_arctica.AAC.1